MTSLWQRLKSGLKKSSDTLSENLKAVFVHKKLDAQTLDQIEETLIMADLGTTVAAKIRASLAKNRMDQGISEDELKAYIADQIAETLSVSEQSLQINTSYKPHVVLVIGVNGAGKTTTISKLSKVWLDQGLKVELAACDTFRAAAVEQLKVWGSRLNIPVYSGKENADAAGLAFDALQSATQHAADVLCIDTAGRLHNKNHLMDELKKIIRVIKKVDPTAPHTTLLILDATTGQNAHSQLEIFHKEVSVDGLIVTKLDGTAKGGVVVGLSEKFKLPVHYIGVGETANDLQPFTSRDFARNLLGIDEQ